jgi:hypothetical protein
MASLFPTTIIARNKPLSVAPKAPEGFKKTCACGAKYTARTWNKLRSPGTWRLGDDVFDLRDCRCGSTIAREVST